MGAGRRLCVRHEVVDLRNDYEGDLRWLEGPQRSFRLVQAVEPHGASLPDREGFSDPYPSVHAYPDIEIDDPGLKRADRK